jgi:hypothetical protein
MRCRGDSAAAELLLLLLLLLLVLAQDTLRDSENPLSQATLAPVRYIYNNNKAPSSTFKWYDYSRRSVINREKLIALAVVYM